MPKILAVKNVAELFRQVPRYATNGSNLTRNGARSIKPSYVKLLCAEKRAEGKSYTQIVRELRARRVRIDRDTVSKILHEPEIVAAIEGEYEAGLERIKEGIRQQFAEQAKVEQQRHEEHRRRWEIQAEKARIRAREHHRRLKEQTPSEFSESEAGQALDAEVSR